MNLMKEIRQQAQYRCTRFGKLEEFSEEFTLPIVVGTNRSLRFLLRKIEKEHPNRRDIEVLRVKKL